MDIIRLAITPISLLSALIVIWALFKGYIETDQGRHLGWGIALLGVGTAGWGIAALIDRESLWVFWFGLVSLFGWAMTHHVVFQPVLGRLWWLVPVGIIGASAAWAAY